MPLNSGVSVHLTLNISILTSVNKVLAHIGGVPSHISSSLVYPLAPISNQHQIFYPSGMQRLDYIFHT